MILSSGGLRIVKDVPLQAGSNVNKNVINDAGEINKFIKCVFYLCVAQDVVHVVPVVAAAGGIRSSSGSVETCHFSDSK